MSWGSAGTPHPPPRHFRRNPQPPARKPTRAASDPPVFFHLIFLVNATTSSSRLICCRIVILPNAELTDGQTTTSPCTPHLPPHSDHNAWSLRFPYQTTYIHPLRIHSRSAGATVASGAKSIRTHHAIRDGFMKCTRVGTPSHRGAREQRSSTVCTTEPVCLCRC